MGLELEAKAHKLVNEAMEKARRDQMNRGPACPTTTTTATPIALISATPSGPNEKKRKRQPRGPTSTAISLQTPVPLIKPPPSPLPMPIQDHMGIDNSLSPVPQSNPLAHTTTVLPPTAGGLLNEGQLIRHPQTAEYPPVYQIDDLAIDEITARLDNTNLVRSKFKLSNVNCLIGSI